MSDLFRYTLGEGRSCGMNEVPAGFGAVT